MNGKLIQVALAEYGTKEIVGDEDNPAVIKYFHEIGHTWVKHDEIAWCSAFVNWVARKAGYEWTGLLNARSWLEIGEEIEHPTLGDIVILWRIKPDSAYGHVGFYINEDDAYVYLLSGNQSNSVNITAYPKYRVIGYRRLNKKMNVK